ncbi:MAG: hypothetical protein ACI93R_002201 [Flavobacteriales bacterium]|jgi:hypothetical protein
MPELYPEDQQKVDVFLKTNVNDVERSGFRPWTLLAVIVVMIAVITIAGVYLSKGHGVI